MKAAMILITIASLAAQAFAVPLDGAPVLEARKNGAKLEVSSTFAKWMHAAF